MATNDHKKRFGLSTSVEDHMAILKVLAKNDNDAISRFWKSNAADANVKKTMLFHTLAMLDPARLHAWIASTPVFWWEQEKKAKPAPDGSATSTPGNRYDSIAGGMLHYLHQDNRPVFMELLQKSPHLFKSQSCRFYMDEWGKDLKPEDLEIFQPLLATQSSSWYVTNPWRINLLLSAPGHREDELMLSASLAADGVMHPAFEAKYPGVQACIHVAHGMFNDTKQKKQFIRKWFMALNGPQKDVLTLDLPELGGPD